MYRQFLVVGMSEETPVAAFSSLGDAAAYAEAITPNVHGEVYAPISVINWIEHLLDLDFSYDDIGRSMEMALEVSFQPEPRRPF